MSTTKSLKVDFDVQPMLESISKFTSELKDMQDKVDPIVKELKKIKKESEENTEKELKGIGKIFETIGSETRELFQSFKEDAKEFLTDLATDIFNPITSTFENILENTKDELQSILGYSQLSNKRTRELAYTYGFSSAQAYGFDKALQMTPGISSEEDLAYANSQQLAQFRESFEKYSNEYTELYDSGFFEEMQEYQNEMAQFKQDVTLEIVKFVVQNKETIMLGMKALLRIAEVVVKIFNSIVGFFGGEQITAESVDSAAQYNNTTNSSSNTNVNINNRFENISKDDTTWLANAGNLTYEQVIKALGGN